MNYSIPLTKRQGQITLGLVMGLEHKEIACQLNRSPRTIENTIVNALRRIGGKKSADLVVYWFVRHFSIPLESLPRSMAALAFLLLFGSYEINTRQNITRVTRRAKDEYECIADVIDFKAPEYISI